MMIHSLYLAGTIGIGQQYRHYIIVILECKLQLCRDTVLLILW